MRFLHPTLILLLLWSSLALAASAPKFERMDLNTVLFGVEYTAQDEGMVNESGRMTMETKHKRKVFEALREAYAKQLGLPKSAGAPEGDGDFKPGASLEVPGDGKHVLTMEPVTIEANTPPRRFFEIRESGEKIFKAFKKAKLVPYVNPAAERSGMGHIHVGAYKMADNPFYKYPNLLRNMMVYAHKHPSLMWGFAEAYDIGGASNITTLHNHNPLLERTGEDHLREYDPDYIEELKKKSNMRAVNAEKQEQAFFRAVEKFDDWYEKALKKGDVSDGLRQYLRFLKAEGLDSTFYHYGMFNLEHLEWLANRSTPLPPGYQHHTKATVETRNWRPPSSPEMAEANAELLLTEMDKFSEPGLLEDVRSISPGEYNRFHSASVVLDDWEKVKKDLGRSNPLWDESIREYTDVQLKAKAIKFQIPDLVGWNERMKTKKAELIPAYSPKFKKGTKWEIRIPWAENLKSPNIKFNGEPLEFQVVKIEGKKYFVSVLDVGEDAKDSYKIVAKFVKPKTCAKWFEVFMPKKAPGPRVRVN